MHLRKYQIVGFRTANEVGGLSRLSLNKVESANLSLDAGRRLRQ